MKYLLYILTYTFLAFAQGATIEPYQGTEEENALTEFLTIITTTSPIPSHPSTEMLEITQKSLFRIPALRGCHKIIVFDGIPQGHEAVTEDYNAYKENVIRLTQEDPYFADTTLVFCETHLHLAHAIKKALKEVSTPFVFLHQHDFVLQKDFDVINLIRSMAVNSNLKHVRLNRLWNYPFKDWDYIVDEEIEGETFVPLCRTFGWSDNDHFSPVSYYKEFVLPRIWWKASMEWVLHPEEVTVTKEDPSKHSDYGTYLYGPLGDGVYLKHLDGKRYPDPAHY